jgi:EpsI family protein
MNRRDVLLGGALLAAAGGAAALTPRNRLVLLGDQKLDDIIPDRIGAWTHIQSNGFVLPKSPGSLADRLYSQTLTRLYAAPDMPPVMLVIAYGAVQNDLLQLHRPEVCYASVGFIISASQRAMVDLGGGAELPVRELTARTESRVEEICYWTRIGDDLPTSGSEQRLVKLRQQMRGYLADGILVRMSTLGIEGETQFALLRRFAAEMIDAVKPADRPVLIGRPLAAATKA